MSPTVKFKSPSSWELLKFCRAAIKLQFWKGTDISNHPQSSPNYSTRISKVIANFSSIFRASGPVYSSFLLGIAQDFGIKINFGIPPPPQKMPNHDTITEQGYSRLVITQNPVSSQYTRSDLTSGQLLSQTAKFTRFCLGKLVKILDVAGKQLILEFDRQFQMSLNHPKITN